MSPRRLRAGFTLIELLVVIAIIALLVSILLPSLVKAKQLARRTICATNLHSIGLEIHMYAADFDGRTPPHENSPRNYISHAHATQKIFYNSNWGSDPKRWPLNFGILFDAGYIDKPEWMYCPDQKFGPFRFDYGPYQEYWRTKDTKKTQVFCSYIYDPNPDFEEGEEYKHQGRPPKHPRVDTMPPRLILGMDYLGRQVHRMAHQTLGPGWNILRADNSAQWYESQEVYDRVQDIHGHSRWPGFLPLRDILEAM